MTLLDDPPAVEPTAQMSSPVISRSGLATWRFAGRLARRDVRRRPGRTMLIALLIAVPVCVMTIGSVFVRTGDTDWPDRFERRFGTADVAIDEQFVAFTSEDDGQGTPALPDGTRSIEYAWSATTFTPAPTSGVASTWGTFTDIPLDDPMTAGIIEIVSGRAPGVGEMMIAPEIAKTWNLDVGDSIELARPSGTWTISGVARFNDNYWDRVVVVSEFPSDRLVDPSWRGYGPTLTTVTLYDLPDTASPRDVTQLAAAVGGVDRFVDPSPFENVDSAIGWGCVFGMLALVAVGIIVAAAFATSARRQLVTVGHLAANGATPRLIRRTLSLQGTWSGCIGAVLGVGVGLVSLPFLRGLAERTIQHSLPGYRISVIDLTVIGLTAIVVATIAAAVPARSVGRIPVMAALAGRRPLGRPPRWLVPTGIALVLVGLGLIAVAATGSRLDSGGQSTTMWSLMIVLGGVAVVFGMCCSTPLVVERVGRSGRRLSLSWRMALRSLARSRTRSAAVVAAIAVAVAAAVAGAAVGEMVVAHDEASYLPEVPSGVVVFDFFEEAPCCEGVVDLGPLESVDIPQSLIDDLAALFPDVRIEPLRVATLDPVAVDFDSPFLEQDAPTNVGPYVADPGIIDIFGFSGEDLATLRESGALQGSWEPAVNDDAGMGTLYQAESGDIVVDLPFNKKRPAYAYGTWSAAITPEHADELGFQLVDRGVVADIGRPLTNAERGSILTLTRSLNDARIGGQFDDIFVEPGDVDRSNFEDGETLYSGWNARVDDPSFRGGADVWLLRALIVGAALLLSVAVVAIGLSLAAAEGRDERDVLAVVGARPASMRRQAAAKAAVLALVGIALGIPTGFLPTWVLDRAATVGDESPAALEFPWLVVTTLLVAVPTLAGIAAWFGSGVAQRLRPIRISPRR